MDENTTCTLSSPLTDDNLEQLLNGERDAVLEDHLAQCPSCNGRFEDLKLFESRLSQRLFRWDCPTSDQLGDYHMDLLAAEDRQRVANHVSSCLYCQAELKTLADFMGDDSVETSKPESPAEASPMSYLHSSATILAHISTGGSPVLRGGNRGPVMLETDTDLTIFAEIQTTSSGAILIGQLVSVQLDAWNHTLVEVRQTGERNKYTVVSDLGEFQCEIAPAGSIRLRLANNRSHIVDTPELFSEDEA